MTSKAPLTHRRNIGLVTPLSAFRQSPLPEMEYGEEIEETQTDSNAILLQQFVEASTEAAKGQSELIAEQRKVEKEDFMPACRFGLVPR